MVINVFIPYNHAGAIVFGGFNPYAKRAVADRIRIYRVGCVGDCRKIHSLIPHDEPLL